MEQYSVQDSRSLPFPITPRNNKEQNMADEENDAENLVVQELRQRFFDENADLQEFDDQDVKRLRRDDIWLRCFVRTRKQDVEKALEALVECLKWRKSFGVNGLTEAQLDRGLLEAGFLYPHGQDKAGNTIVIFAGKLHKKDPQKHPDLKRFLVFILEKHAKMFPGRKVTLIFDMQETGFVNMDMDFIKFIITCFKNYFPYTLAWLLVLELPWILSAAWKIVKTWLSQEAIAKIKFINKSELQDYVDEENLQLRLGGTDTYEYSYPLTKEDLESLGVSNSLILSGVNDDAGHTNGIGKQLSQDTEDSSEDQQPMLSLEQDDAEGLPSKKVKFAENEKDDGKSEVNSRGKGSRSSMKLQTKHSPKISLQENGTGPHLLTITPADELLFTGSTTGVEEILQILKLTNSSSSDVAFKVKTTSPESYRVRPSSGMITPSASAEVSVYLQPGHAASVVRDKFLVMSTEVDDDKTPTELAHVWKTTPKTGIIEHRLRCRFVTPNSPQSASPELLDGGSVNLVKMRESIGALRQQLSDMEKKIDVVNKKISYVEEGLQVFIKVQLALFSGMVVLFAVVFYYVTFMFSH